MSTIFLPELRVSRLLRLLCIVAAGLAFVAAARAAVVIKIGDTVYVDGKEYSWEDWKKMRDNPAQAAPAATPAVVPTAGPSSSAGPRTATCTTPVYYDEFPKDGDEFQCSGGLGSLTREQIVQRGWKVDFIEKLPAPAGQPASSPRGLPLNLYKLVISR